MFIEVDFNSSEALYIQLRNQIIVAIAEERFREGDSLPSVRQMANAIGINMHTVNKAYAVLREEGFVKLDRRRGAVICLGEDKSDTLAQMRREMSVILAAGVCKGITREEAHALVDSIFEDIARCECRCGRLAAKKEDHS